MPIIVHIIPGAASDPAPIPGKGFYDFKDLDRAQRKDIREKGPEGSGGAATNLRGFTWPQERASKRRMRAMERR